MRKREQNLDVLRCLAMMMVVVLHYLSKGGILGDLSEKTLSDTQMAAWVIESLCIVAVNVYMLISGYFLCSAEFRISRLLGLYGQLWFYSVGVGLLSALCGWVPAEELTIHYCLMLLFPVSMGHYWFLTAYVFLYLLLPLVGRAVNGLTQRQLRAVLALLLLVFSVLKSVLPVRLETDAKGYDCIWYLTVFLIGAYFRRFGHGSRRGLILYFAGCAGVLAEIFVLRGIYLRTGSLGRMMNVSMEYNHIFVLLASVGLFLFFRALSVPRGLGALAERLAPYTLGVYLLHENIAVRYLWQNWFHADRMRGPGELILWTVLAAITVFAVGVAVDFLRSCVSRSFGALFGGEKGPVAALSGRIRRWDELWRTEGENRTEDNAEHEKP